MTPESNVSRYIDGPVFVAGPYEFHPSVVPGIDGIEFYEPSLCCGSKQPEVFSMRLEGLTMESAKIYRVRPASLGTVGGDRLNSRDGFSLKLRVEKGGVTCFPSHDGQPNFKGELVSVTTDGGKKFITVGRRGQIDLPGGVVLIPLITSDEDYVNGVIVMGKRFFNERGTQSFIEKSLRHGVTLKQLWS